MAQQTTRSTANDLLWFEHEAKRTLARILPRLEANLLNDIDEAMKAAFLDRLRRQFPRLFRLLFELYGERYDFFYHLQDLLERTASLWIQDLTELKGIDALREDDPAGLFLIALSEQCAMSIYSLII